MSSYKLSLFVNELSFKGQGKDSIDCNSLLREFAAAVAAFCKLSRFDKVWSHTALATASVGDGISLYTALQQCRIDDTIRLTLQLLRRGENVDTYLRKVAPMHGCQFLDVEYRFSGLAGAAKLGGTLLSLRNSCFPEVLEARYSDDGSQWRDVSVANVQCAASVRARFVRKFVQSPKHHLNSARGSPMDLSEECATEALNAGVLIDKYKQVFAFYRNAYYEFQPDNAGGFHGYRIKEENVPHECLLAMKQLGLINPQDD